MRNQRNTKEKIEKLNKFNNNKNNIELNQHKKLDPIFSYNKNPWFVNFSNKKLDSEIQDLLRLEDSLFCIKKITNF